MDIYIGTITTCHFFVIDYFRTKDLRNIDEIGNSMFDLFDRPHRMLDHEKSTFFDRYKNDLFDIAQVLRSVSKEHKKLRFSRNNIRPQFLIEKVMEELFSYITLMKKLTDFIAIVMREFMKGITYFDKDGADERIDHPIYHRDVSCGSRQKLHELDCSKFYDDPPEFFRRSLKNRKCTIERQVYDRLFIEYFPSKEQDFGHRMMREMSRREDFFNKCFPSTTIEIKVTFDNNGIPIGLTIGQCNSTRISWEIYAKTCRVYDERKVNWRKIASLDKNLVLHIYNDEVVGKRLVYDRTNSIKVYSEKKQTFYSPTDAWEREDIEQMKSTNTFSNSAVKSQLSKK